MIDFEKMNREWREKLTPEELERVQAYEAREERYDSTASDILATFERLAWGAAPPVPAPSAPRLPGGFGNPFARRSSMVAQPSRTSAVPVRRERMDIESHVAKTWDKVIRVRIEDRVNHEGTTREVIRFMEGGVGDGAYHLDEDFARMLSDPEERAARPRFYICAGTPGSYEGCSVSHDDVEAYVRRMRPHLFIDAVPDAPGMR